MRLWHDSCISTRMDRLRFSSTLQTVGSQIIALMQTLPSFQGKFVSHHERDRRQESICTDHEGLLGRHGRFPTVFFFRCWQNT